MDMSPEEKYRDEQLALRHDRLRESPSGAAEYRIAQLERELIEQQQIAGMRAEEIASLQRELAQAQAELAEERETVRAHGEEIFRLQAEAAANARTIQAFREVVRALVEKHKGCGVTKCRYSMNVGCECEGIALVIYANVEDAALSAAGREGEK